MNEGSPRCNPGSAIHFHRLFQLAASLLGASGVAFGAWGAHGLVGYLGEGALISWQTGVAYQLFHAILLFAIGIKQAAGKTGWPVVTSGAFIFLGALMFSGSIYLMLLLNWNWLWPITPLGGLFLILGWLLMLYDAINS